MGEKSLNTALKASALVALLAYLDGVLAVGTYLQHQDIPTPDLTVFKTHYVYTGLEVLLLLGLAAFAAFAFLAAFRSPGSKYQYLWTPLILALSLLAYRYVLRQTAPWHGSLDQTEKAAIFVAVGLLAPIPALVWFPPKFDPPDATSAEGAGNSEGPSRVRKAVAASKRLPDPTQVGLASVFALLCVIASTVLFGRWAYPHLAEQWGGGSPKGARVLFTKAGAIEAAQFGIPIQPHRQVSMPVELLFTGDTFYALEVRATSRVFQIAKSSVDALLLDTHRPYATEALVKGPAGSDLARRGEHLILRYSEKIYPPSLLPNWRGDRVPAELLERSADSNDDALSILTQPSKTGGRRPHSLSFQLGSLDIEPTRLLGPKAVPVWVAMRGSEVVVTLRHDGLRPGRELRCLRWNPSDQSEDIAGNQSEKTMAPLGNWPGCKTS